MITQFLLVDDDSDEQMIFTEALGEVDKKLHLEIASDGCEVIERLDSGSLHVPQLAFLDINMPVMNGWECLAQLKQHARYKDIPVLMYSTSSNPKDIEKALSLHAIGFYTKPTNFEELKAFLDHMKSAESDHVLEALLNFAKTNPKGFHLE